MPRSAEPSVPLFSSNRMLQAVWQIAKAIPDAAAMIAKDARENLGGVEVVSVGSVFAREIQGVMCHAVVAIEPDRDGKDWVPSEVILDVRRITWSLALIGRR